MATIVKHTIQKLTYKHMCKYGYGFGLYS